MKFGKIDRIILFGGSDFLAEFAQIISKEGKYNLCVFSSKRHIEERLATKKSIPLGEYLKDLDVPYFETRNINLDSSFKHYVNEKTLGISFGASWIFEQKTVKSFAKNHLLDFMGVNLPKYRGGAHYTWQILHKNRIGALNLQIISGGDETFHKGKLLKRTVYKLPTNLKTPYDFFKYNILKTKNFLTNFLKELESGKNFSLFELDEFLGSYYPFLSTEANGLINWDWKGSEIALFIAAFDEPYKGASTFLRGKKVYLKKCKLLKQDDVYHPFSSGLIVKKDRDAIYIATIGKLLRVEKVFSVGGEINFKHINLGDRFQTPYRELDKARSFRAEYDWKGLKKA